MNPPRRRPRPGRPSLRAVLVLACTSPGHALAQPPDSVTAQATRDAWLDETARRLVHGARHARDTARLGVGSYTAIVRERVGFMLPSFRRDRPWVSGERSARIRWSQGGRGEVHVLQARFRRTGPAPGALGRAFPRLHEERLAADPYGNPFVFGLGPPIGASLGTGEIVVRDPLGKDAERYYQFRSGDTVRIVAGGDTVDAVTVTVVPRYRGIRLVAAILWIDPDSHALVRVAYRPAKRVDREMRGRLRHCGEWRPRVWIDGGGGGAPGGAAEGTPGDGPATAVGEDPASVSGGRSANAPPGVPFTVDWAVKIEDVRGPGEGLSADPAAATDGLDPLPPSVWLDGSTVWQDISSIWLDRPYVWRGSPEVAADLAAIGIGHGDERSEAANPWFIFPPGMVLGLMRYTPVEGFSAGGQVRRDFRWWRSALTVRIPTGGWAVPDMDFTVQHDHPRRRTQFSVYRQLRGGALGIGGLEGWTGYFVRAADSVNFHWSHGATLRFTPGNGKRIRGLFRLDVARGFECGTAGSSEAGWRVHPRAFTYF